MRFGEWLKLVLLEEVEDALSEERRDEADVVSEVEVFEELNAFAAGEMMLSVSV